MAITYEPITTTTLGSDTASITYSSLGSYTDIVIVANAALSATADLSIRFNGDTGANYSMTLLKGNGTTTEGYRETNTTSSRIGQCVTSPRGAYVLNIYNYANSNVYKTTVSRDNLPTSNASSWVSTWRNTAAITSITLFGNGSSNLKSGSTFTLYGIKAA